MAFIYIYLLLVYTNLYGRLLEIVYPIHAYTCGIMPTTAYLPSDLQS